MYFILICDTFDVFQDYFFLNITRRLDNSYWKITRFMTIDPNFVNIFWILLVFSLHLWRKDNGAILESKHFLKPLDYLNSTIWINLNYVPCIRPFSILPDLHLPIIWQNLRIEMRKVSAPDLGILEGTQNIFLITYQSYGILAIALQNLTA